MRQGIVVSDKADKTITVRIDVARRHRRYEKIVRSSSTLHAHDERNDANEGDLVRVAVGRQQPEAELIQNLLLEEGVPSTLRRTRGFDVPEIDGISAGGMPDRV